MRRHFAIAWAGILLSGGASHAEFLGVEIYSVNHWFGQDINVGGGAVQTAFNAANLDSYRIYAVFDAVTDVQAGFGDHSDQHAYIRNLDSGTFYNYTETAKGNTFHFDNQAFTSGFSANPGRAYDTFATVGGVTSGTDATQFTPPGAGPDNGGIGNHFQNDWSSVEGIGGTYAWFVFGPSPQTITTQNPVGLFSANSPHAFDGRYYLLLFQATVPKGEQIEGSIGVALRSPVVIYNDERNYFTTVPAPATGLVALFGLTGLARSRRRVIERGELYKEGTR